MTETDAGQRPLTMPEKFIPYLEKYRIYLLLKDLVRDIVISLPRDQLKHMKVFLSRHIHCTQDADRVILLASPDLRIDVKRLVKEMIKDLGFFVITRRCILDRYEKHDDYEPGCFSPTLMSEVTKNMTMKDPVIHAGWLMFDHPCTVREARCMQQDGVLPTVTLVLMPTPTPAPPTDNACTPPRSFFQQDFEGLKFAYKATVKEVHFDPDDDLDKMSCKCFNAIRASISGAQGPGQGHHVVGAPGTYRVIILGPRGAGRKTQSRLLAHHFGLVYLNFDDVYKEAREKNDDVGEKLRDFGANVQLKAELVKRRILKKDCVDHGWVLTGYPSAGIDFEQLDNMPTPPNRIIFLNADWNTCKARALAVGVDWCTGRRATPGTGPRVVAHPGLNEADIDYEIEAFFSEALAELHAAAGITAVEISALEPVDEVQTKIQAAVIAAPAFDIECCSRLRNVRAD